MSARYDIAALGELLIDFTDSGVSPGGFSSVIPAERPPMC